MQVETQRFRSNGANAVRAPVAQGNDLILADRAGFLQAMSNVANSVAVVTTNGPEGKLGQTVTSFCSVSADPPQVLCCIRVVSPLRSAIELNGCFAVNVLGENQSGIADTFAGRATEFPAYSFDHIPHRSDDNGCPTFDDASCIFSCQVAEAITSGTHAIFVGIVTLVRCGVEAPLLYHARGYGKHVGLGKSQ